MWLRRRAQFIKSEYPQSGKPQRYLGSPVIGADPTKSPATNSPPTSTPTARRCPVERPAAASRHVTQEEVRRIVSSSVAYRTEGTVWAAHSGFACVVSGALMMPRGLSIARNAKTNR